VVDFLLQQNMIKKTLFYLLLLALISCQKEIDDLNVLVPATVVEDPNLPQIQISVGGKLRSIHIETFGDPNNPVLFILHGSVGDYRAWLPYQILSDKYYVVMWDQRGTGLSERVTKSEISSENMIEEIDAIKSVYSPNDKINILSHSFGAMYAAFYCGQRPNSVNQVVLIEPGGLTGELMQIALDEGFKLDFFDEQLTQQYWQNELLSAKGHEELDYKTMMLLHGNANQYYCDNDNKPEWPIWRVGGLVEINRVPLENNKPVYDYTLGLQNFTNKVLILASSCSSLGFDYQVNYHKDLFSDVEIIKFENCGHRLSLERFDDVVTQLKIYYEEY
jgi:proline iminopeptidase